MNMNNKIPIDRLFQEKLSEGKEPLNLGAWTNMEQLLEGKNPYQERSESKRRILPLFFLLATLGVLSTAGILYYQPFKKDENKITNKSKSVSYNEFDKVLDESISNALAFQSNLSEPTKVSFKKQNNTYHQKDYLTNTDDYESEHIEKRGFASKSNVRIKNNTKEDLNYVRIEPARNPELKENPLAQADLTISNPNYANSNAISNISDSSPISDMVASDNNKRFDTVHQIFLNEKITKSQDNKHIISYDTIKRSFIVNERTINTNTSDKDGKYHPRYVLLSPEQEAANAKTIEMAPEVALASTVFINAKHSEASKSNLSDEKSAKNPEDGAFNQKVKNTFNKLSIVGMSLLGMNIPSNPGIIMGVNASIFGTQYNFGGFHAGLTNTFRLSETFNILTELKYFYKNNGGYSVKDYSTRINNTSVDSVSLASENKNIYYYQLDSTTRIYNFKNIMSLEMPILLQANLRNFRAYGGLNMAYNFRLNYKQSVKNEVVSRTEIQSKSVPFEYPQTKGETFVTDDFNARFGLGYALGTSYHFNPNLYLDMRITNILWDNTKTNSAREISNATFKVPSLQLSIGYRFNNSQKNK